MNSVKFHLDRCTITDPEVDLSFNIIENGCGATILDTSLLSEIAYQNQVVKWRFRSFQFQKDRINEELFLDCKVDFVLCNQQNCTYPENECP